MIKIISTQKSAPAREPFFEHSYETLTRTLSEGFGIYITLQQTKDGEYVVSEEPYITIRGEVAMTIAEMTLAEINTYERDGHHVAALNHLLAICNLYRSRLFPNGKSRYSFLLINCAHVPHEQERLDFLFEKLSWLDRSTFALVGLKPQAAAYINSKDRLSPLAVLDDYPEEDRPIRIPSLGFDVICTAHPHSVRGSSMARETLLERLRIADMIRYTKKIASSPLSKLVFLFYKKVLERFMLPLMEYIEGKSGILLTYQLRPLYAKDFEDTPDKLLKGLSCAIVIQGPLARKNDFTLETVRLYKKIFPGLTIIVSTWEGEDPTYVRKISEEGVEVILSTASSYVDPLNMNLQVTSSQNGIQKAKEMGAQYVCKIRSDMRIYNKSIFEAMCNMLEYFPPSERSRQHKRLLFLHNAGKYGPYAFSDMFAFGEINDMLSYWSPTLLKRDETYTFITPESYFAREFFKSHGWTLDWSLKQWWTILRECVITLDWAMIDIVFYKYNHFRQHHHQRYYEAPHVPSEDFLPFTDWFNIFSNPENKICTPQQDIHMRGFSAHKQEKTEE